MASRRSTRPKWRWWLPPTPAPRHCGSPLAPPNSATPCRRRRPSFTSPFGRGRREAPGEGFRSIERAYPLTRIANAIRPLPMGEGKKNQLRYRLVAARGGDGVQADIAEHMRHEARGLEYFRERRVAD